MAEYSYVLENTRKTAKHSKVGSSLSTYVELCLFDIMGYCVCILRASFTGTKNNLLLRVPQPFRTLHKSGTESITEKLATISPCVTFPATTTNHR